MNALVIYIMGVSGSGKTTIGRKLSAVLNLPFFDADDFHPAANKEKMRSGLPLNDDDREDWLLAIHQLAKEEAGKKGAVIACSALKGKYRAILSKDIKEAVRWVFLQGDYKLIYERINERKEHFMPGALLQSQFDTLEIPANAITIGIDRKPADIVEEIIQRLDTPSL